MSIFVLYNGQKKSIKVAPNTLMVTVLQEAASSFHVDSNNYVLKHKRTVINNSEPFRFANIPNNATLDLEVVEKSKTTVGGGGLTKVALSIEGLGSITGTYDSSYSLYQMIESLSNEGKLPSNISSSSMELIYLRTAYKGIDEMSKVTFASLGLAGQSVRLQLRSTSIIAAAASISASAELTPSNITTNETSNITTNEKTTDNESNNINTSAQTIFTTTPMELAREDIKDLKEAIKSMLAQNFDQVSSPAIITILKYIYNILRYPDDAKYRTISTGNKAFQEKIANAKGVSDVLTGVGFTFVDNSNPRSYVLNGSSSEVRSKLEKAETHLIDAMNTLQVPDDQRPLKQIAVPIRHESSIPVVAFDPYKAAVVRNAPQPYRGESDVDKRLAIINKRRHDLEGDPDSVERLTEVCMPDGSGNFKQVDEDIDSGEKSDSKIVARSIMNALKKNSDEAPLTTKAIRDLEKAQNEKVYSRTLIRIKFPDRLCLSGYFHPRNTVREVYEWAYSCLSFNVDINSKFFELYTSPPRTVLPLDKSLIDLQLVPAALIHVSWSNQGLEAISNLSSSSIGSYLTDSLLLKASEKREQSTSFPTGEQLVTSSSSSSSGAAKEIMMSTEPSGDKEIDLNADKKENNNDPKKKPKWLNSMFK